MVMSDWGCEFFEIDDECRYTGTPGQYDVADLCGYIPKQHQRYIDARMCEWARMRNVCLIAIGCFQGFIHLVVACWSITLAGTLDPLRGLTRLIFLKLDSNTIGGMSEHKVVLTSCVGFGGTRLIKVVSRRVVSTRLFVSVCLTC
jgi:hypothetical protein